MNLDANDPLAVVAVSAMRKGDVESLQRLLAENPDLARATITRPPNGRETFFFPLLSAAVDWPGHFPNVAATIDALVGAGADVNARCSGRHRETPLHWAASSDDVAALDAVLDAGADIEAAGAAIADGTALDDAVAFGQWNAARRLVERGAQASLWNAAALGLMDRVEERVAGAPPDRFAWGRSTPDPPDRVTSAFWVACHGGQRRSAEYLLERGADLNWASTWDGLTPLDAAERSGATELVVWLRAVGAKPSADLA